MPLRSGLAAQIGYAAETTWGTYVAPTRFLEFNSESLQLNIERIESQGLRAGNRVLRSDRWAANKKGIEGDVEHEVQSKGFGLLFKAMLGAVAISTPTGGTATRDHLHTLADPFGQSLTVQVGRPDVAGVVQPFSYLGCKVAEWEFANSVDEILMLTLSLDGKDETTAQALAAASYPSSSELLTFVGATLSIGGAQYDVSEVSIKGSNGLATERYFLRADTTKKEQIPAEMVEITAEVTGEFDGLTQYQRYTGGTTAALVAKWEGSTIEGSFKNTVQVTLPVCRVDGETPNVEGPEILEQSLTLKALFDGTQEPIQLLYRTTDTAS